MKYLIRYWAIIAFLLSIFAISSALTAEYIFDIFPCKMCLNQRYSYYFIISIFTLFYFFKKTSSIWLYILTELAVLYGLFYAVWHIGIESNLLTGPSSCSGRLKEVSAIDNLKEQILNQAIVSCNEVTWSILGLSAAKLNFLLMFLFLLFNTMFIIKVYYGKEKNN